MSTCQLIIDLNKTIPAAFITRLVRHPEKTKLSGETRMYCSPDYGKFLRHPVQSTENRRKECHRFCLRLRYAVILTSNDRTSASKKINRMALIRTLTVSTTVFERTKKKFYGFQQIL